MDNNVTLCVNGELQPGDLVLSLPDNDYGLLVGEVAAINKPGSPEQETENTTDDVHVDFTAYDYFGIRFKEITEAFSKLYGRPVNFDELPLDDVIMAPDIPSTLAQKINLPLWKPYFSMCPIVSR